MNILERNIIKNIKVFIDSKDVIVLHGARQVGKTSILKYLENELVSKGKKVFYLDLEDLRFVDLLNSGVDNFIKYLKEKGLLKDSMLYVFIDEIQYLKNPSNFLKLIRDHYSDKIKLFVSGSSSFEIKNKFKESLVGRTVNYEIYPLSFKEYLVFKGYNINYNKHFLSDFTTNELKKFYNDYIIYGGYPRVVMEEDVRKKEIYLQQIIDTYIRKDIRDLANIKDILKFNKLLEVLSSQTGNMLNIVELSNASKMARPTTENYIFLMENTYILKLLRPFSSNLRSELFKTPKIYFYDTGIANMLWFKTFPKTVEGLYNKPTIAHNIINRTPPDIEDLVIKVRKEKNYGSLRISWYLQRHHNIYLSSTTINKILKRNNIGLISNKNTPRISTPKIVSKENPGDRLQIDVKFLNKLGREKKRYFQFTAIDDCTRYRVLHIYSYNSEKSAIDFVDLVRQKLPFAIKEIQTDNGSEFGSNFTWHINDLGITHRKTYPRCPKQNGKVERSHRTDEEEFYKKHQFTSKEELEKRIIEWEKEYNFGRPHMSLKGLTPSEKLYKIMATNKEKESVQEGA